MINESLLRKLCYIFHRGFVESRLLALGGQSKQAADLADAFEIMPGYLPDWSEENLAMIRSHLHEYQDKYGAAGFDYLAVLDMEDEAFIEIHSRW